MTNAEARFNKSLRPRKPEGIIIIIKLSMGFASNPQHFDAAPQPVWSVVLKSFCTSASAARPGRCSTSRELSVYFLPLLVLCTSKSIHRGDGLPGPSWTDDCRQHNVRARHRHNRSVLTCSQAKLFCKQPSLLSRWLRFVCFVGLQPIIDTMVSVRCVYT